MLEGLRDRLAKATGPDRDIDKAIHGELLGKCLHPRTTWSGAQSDTGRTCDDCGADSWGNRGGDGQRLHDSVPAYTASIDAAVTLVPTDDHGVNWDVEGVHGGVCAYVWLEHPAAVHGFVRTPLSKSRAEAMRLLPLTICRSRIEYELAQLPEERT
jgi:hypothetical protein